MIPSNILEKYGILESLEERLRITREMGMSDTDATIDYYRSFLVCTDHIPNKIIEAQALGETPEDYTEILNYRQFARDEINRLSK